MRPFVVRSLARRFGLALCTTVSASVALSGCAASRDGEVASFNDSSAATGGGALSGAAGAAVQQLAGAGAGGADERTVGSADAGASSRDAANDTVDSASMVDASNAGVIGGKPLNLAFNKPTLPAGMEKMVDGSLTSGDINFGTSGSFSIDLGKPTSLGRAIFSQVSGHAFAQAISFAVSDDGQTWNDLWKGTSGNEFYMFLEAEIVFAPTTARYFKVNYGSPFIDGFILENEFELYAPDTTSTDLALGKVASSSVDTKYQTPISVLTDGLVGGDPWHGVSKPGTIAVDLGSNATVNRVRLISDTHNATSKCSFDVSTDNATWTTVVANAGSGFHDLVFDAVVSRYVRCNIEEVNLSDVGAPGLVARELQVYGPGGIR